jgi:ATPase subunit of ABC transporter with duplicated ATPase domains
VVSHDRYLLERITDQQYAILDGHLRHLPGGVDEYLELRRSADRAAQSSKGSSTPEPPADQLSGAERHAARKELGSAERRLATALKRIAALQDDLTTHDPSDYPGLAKIGEQIAEAEVQQASIEERWLELSELLS